MSFETKTVGNGGSAVYAPAQRVVVFAVLVAGIPSVDDHDALLGAMRDLVEDAFPHGRTSNLWDFPSDPASRAFVVSTEMPTTVNAA